MSRIRWSAVVLAAGRSRRTGGRNKLMMPVDGAPLLHKALDAAAGSRVDEVIVVMGYQAPRVQALASGRLRSRGKPWRTVRAQHYLRGLSASLKAGLKAVSPVSRGAVILLGDMPHVSSGIIDTLIDAYHVGDRAVVPTTDGKWGNPVLLARAIFPRLRALTGDRGARPTLEKLPAGVREVPISETGIHTDIDRPADFKALRPAASAMADG